MKLEQKNLVLKNLAELLLNNKPEIISANQQDISSCSDIDESMLDRLKINEAKIDGMIKSINDTIKSEDAEGRVISSYDHENGMKIKNKSVPFGKVLIIYESRPDVTIEASILAFKSGNQVLLKGGKESKETNKFLVSLWKQALSNNDVNEDYVTYLDMGREQTQELIKNNSHNVDLIIPRGGEGLINFVKNNTDIPLIISGRGNNFLYVDEDSDFDMAVSIISNGKSRLSVCNALDKVLFNSKILGFKEKLSGLVEALSNQGIEILGSNDIAKLNDKIEEVSADKVLGEEFLSAKIFLGLVENKDEAIEIINKYSGSHSAVIVSSDNQSAEEFQTKVDCSAVYHNASTRFTDGGQFGFGAEIAISTQKLHSRGPIGLNQLVTNKWFIYGNGQIR